MHRTLLVLYFLCCLFGVIPAAHADSYTFELIHVPGARYTQANGINDHGQIVGMYQDSSSARAHHGFVYANGTFTPLNAPGNLRLDWAYGINNRGQVVGTCSDSQGAHGCLFNNGTVTLFDVPDSVDTSAQGLNNRGQIVGSYFDGNTWHGYIYDNGAFTSLDVPFPDALPGSTWPWGINDRGLVVGIYVDFNWTHHGFLYNGGAFTPLDVPGTTAADVYGINKRGQIVGAAYASGKAYGFLDDNGVFTFLDAPGAIGTYAQGLNNHGQIVGIYGDRSGVGYGFLATTK